CLLLPLFFFPQSSHTHYINSFPTRRSSDLLKYHNIPTLSGSCQRVFVSNRCSSSDWIWIWDVERRPSSVRTLQYRLRKRHAPTRSEEHTSELQSPDHLVCRLLLEKKNNKTH